VSVDDDPQRFLDLGLRRYPALAHGDRTLSVLFLTKRKIRRFLSDVAASEPGSDPSDPGSE
jgi:hypothetical protein